MEKAIESAFDVSFGIMMGLFISYEVSGNEEVRTCLIVGFFTFVAIWFIRYKIRKQNNIEGE